MILNVEEREWRDNLREGTPETSVHLVFSQVFSSFLINLHSLLNSVCIGLLLLLFYCFYYNWDHIYFFRLKLVVISTVFFFKSTYQHLPVLKIFLLLSSVTQHVWIFYCSGAYFFSVLCCLLLVQLSNTEMCTAVWITSFLYLQSHDLHLPSHLTNLDCQI